MDEKDILDYKAIGGRIRLEREKLNLTREKLAEIVGLSPFYIGQIERGDRKMSLETLARIAYSLRTSVDYILFGSISYEENIIIKKCSIITETICNGSNKICQDLDELISLLINCSNKEISLFRDILKLLLPYLSRG
ncbi:MAG: helix-turn-helix transcriptional regulator [Tissierellia bacterium]|nr:helix-turn-helix transcriptional regulator [Tissierellia bacterium]